MSKPDFIDTYTRLKSNKDIMLLSQEAINQQHHYTTFFVYYL